MLQQSVTDRNVDPQQSFDYAAADTPIVTGISPSVGGTGGGVEVTITGSGFSSAPSQVSAVGRAYVIS